MYAIYPIPRQWLSSQSSLGIFFRCFFFFLSLRNPISSTMPLTIRKNFTPGYKVLFPSLSNPLSFSYFIPPLQSASQPRLSFTEMTEDYPRYPDIHDLDLALLNPRMIVVRLSEEVTEEVTFSLEEKGRWDASEQKNMHTRINN